MVIQPKRPPTPLLPAPSPFMTVTIRVWAELDSQGALVVSGQDLKPHFDEYEYAFVIPREDLPLIQVALDGTHDDSVLELLAENGERLVAEGLMSWLDAVGASYKFWSR